jgi:hypothetical protein
VGRLLSKSTDSSRNSGRKITPVNNSIFSCLSPCSIILGRLSLVKGGQDRRHRCGNVVSMYRSKHKGSKPIDEGDLVRVREPFQCPPPPVKALDLGSLSFLCFSEVFVPTAVVVTSSRDLLSFVLFIVLSTSWSSTIDKPHESHFSSDLIFSLWVAFSILWDSPVSKGFVIFPVLRVLTRDML